MRVPADLKEVQKLLEDQAYIDKALQAEDYVTLPETGHKRSFLNLTLMCNKAAGAGSADIVRYLLTFANSHEIPHEALVHRQSINPAITSNHNDALFNEMIAVEPDAINEYLGHDARPLAYTQGINRSRAQYGNDGAPLVRFLLENGANLNYVRGICCKVPGVYLHSAVDRTSLEVVEMLLQHGAQIEQSGAMHRAAQQGRIDIMELLIQHGADVN